MTKLNPMLRHLSLLALALTLCPTMKAQLVLDQTLTVEQLVQDVLLGTGVQVSNITFNGQPATSVNEQASRFDGSGCNVGMSYGLMLGTGDCAAGIGPNVSGSFSLGGGNQDNSDPDLLTLSGNANIRDAAVLEFDFIPIGDSILFQYVFASDEYLEFVNSVNDAFGFFLSGPGISGPFENDAINIAIIPGTTDPVTINTVNDAVNSQFYIVNGDGTNAPFNSDATYLQYDGLTVVLTARAAVTCGEVHHIKLAIGDAQDTAWDSAVFLQGGSFTSPPFVPVLDAGPGIIGSNLILESCFNVQVNFTRTGDVSQPASVDIYTSGTATAGVDYVPAFPTTLDFPAGVVTVPFQFNAPIDGDDIEDVIITCVSESQCTADSLAIDFVFYITEPQPLITIGSAHLLNCGESVQLTPTVSGGYGEYVFDWSVDAPADSSILYIPTQVQDVTVQITDTCGSASTAFFAVELTQPPPISATLTGPQPLIEGCSEASLVVTRPAGTTGDLLMTVDHSGVATSPADYTVTSPYIIPGGSNTGTATVIPLEDQQGEGEESMVITASYTNACNQSATAQVTNTITDAPAISIETEETLIIPCGADSIPLTVFASGGVQPLSLSWSTGATGPVAYASNSADGQYVVTATDDCGRTYTTMITVDPQCAIVIPNVFSPNGDGRNDVFYVEGILASSASLRVFNRWGQTVYESAGYRNNWSGQDLPDGTYYYELKVDREPEPYTGHVTILKNGRR